MLKIVGRYLLAPIGAGVTVVSLGLADTPSLPTVGAATVAQEDASATLAVLQRLMTAGADLFGMPEESFPSLPGLPANPFAAGAFATPGVAGPVPVAQRKTVAPPEADAVTAPASGAWRPSRPPVPAD